MCSRASTRSSGWRARLALPELTGQPETEHGGGTITTRGLHTLRPCSLPVVTMVDQTRCSTFPTKALTRLEIGPVARNFGSYGKPGVKDDL
jgi:hypothetical protein